MFVLLISSFILLIPVLSIERVTESVQIEMFFRDLTSQISLMQNHAMLASQPTRISFKPQSNTINFRVINTENNELQYHPVNRDIDLKGNPYYRLGGTSNRDFIFKTETGHITNSNSIYFDTNRGRYRLVFQIGSGRIEIREY
jgi:competence protein ComGD